MSHLALRRVMIRMLHDQEFAAAVYADGVRALAGIDVSATELAWLTRQPRAAWRTDPARPARVLAALAEEYPASVPLAVEHAAGFLRSAEFHAAVQERGSLALAFGAHLLRAPVRAARALASLEHAVALVRRAPRAPSPSPAGTLRLTPRAAIRVVPDGTLALLQKIRGGGARDAALDATDETVLIAIHPETTEVTLELLEAALAALLRLAVDGCPRDALQAAARRHGAEPGEDEEIITRLIADHLLL
jgi:hypothetical protein